MSVVFVVEVGLFTIVAGSGRLSSVTNPGTNNYPGWWGGAIVFVAVGRNGTASACEPPELSRNVCNTLAKP